MEDNLIELAPPRYENGRELFITGLSERYSSETNAGIPAQWQRFVPWLGKIPGQIGWVTFGLICRTNDPALFDYMCGVEVENSAAVPPELTRLHLPAQSYAVFTHSQHISKIRSTFRAIFDQWLPNSGHKRADTPTFERYGEEFNPQTGMGGVEIWVPVMNG